MMQVVRGWITKFWKLITPALILAIAIPLWQVYWVQRPEVHVEVTQVDRKALDEARKIALKNDEALSFLAERAFDMIPGKSGRDIDDVAKLLDDFERDIKELQKRVPEQQKQLELLKGETLTWPLVNEIMNDDFTAPEIKRSEFESKLKDASGRSELTASVRDKLEETIKTENEQLVKGNENTQRARARLATLYESLDRNEARIRTGCAVTNSGRGAMSLRREAILRVFLGSNNYIDLELLMDEYAANADLQPKHSRVVTFSSAPIRTLDAAVQDRIRAYWGQNVRSKLFLTDIEGKVYRSPTFPFAQGLYQQLIYDRLKKVAGRDPLTGLGAD